MELEEQHHTSSKNPVQGTQMAFRRERQTRATNSLRDRRSKNREEEERRNATDGGQHPGNPQVFSVSTSTGSFCA